MGGKGKRRREKNYRAAHGGYTGLPPPPDASKHDALPSKLRQIISFTQNPTGPSSSPSSLTCHLFFFVFLIPLLYIQGRLGFQMTRKTLVGMPKMLCEVVALLLVNELWDKTALKDTGDVETVDVKQGISNGQLKAPQLLDRSEEKRMESGGVDKKKKKRKRKEVKDLRYFEAKKKKHKKSNEEKMDFPGQEKIKFGDIVQAPPKLAVPPKAFKNASQERLRLQAIEEYRSRKGWASRPGSHLPPPATTLDP
ncbi:hypothetical protein JHK86_026416 [Glycine max]|nr:hypothetical protein JHK86_026416 [Glycine max]